MSGNHAGAVDVTKEAHPQDGEDHLAPVDREPNTAKTPIEPLEVLRAAPWANSRRTSTITQTHQANSEVGEAPQRAPGTPLQRLLQPVQRGRGSEPDNRKSKTLGAVPAPLSRTAASSSSASGRTSSVMVLMERGGRLVTGGQPK